MNLELKKGQNFKQEFKKRCFDFSIAILKLSDELKIKKTYWSLIDQLVRAGTSIGANVVEGGNSISKREFVNYFQISLKSSSETLYWLTIFKEIEQDLTVETERLIQECIEIKKLIATIILNTKNKF